LRRRPLRRLAAPRDAPGGRRAEGDAEGQGDLLRGARGRPGRRSARRCGRHREMLREEREGEAMTDRIEPAKVRAGVAEAYGRAVAEGGGCCGGGEQKGGAARTAGYASGDLAGLPGDAVENSFGCGNPVALSGVGEGETVVDLGGGAGIDLLLAGRKTGP